MIFVVVSILSVAMKENSKRCKIDFVLPTTGNHGWIVSGAWVRSANEAGLLGNVFRPSSKWGANEPEDDDNLFENLSEDNLSQIVVVLGMDWHSQPLTFTEKWRKAWENCSSIVIAIIWEDYNSQFVAQNVELFEKMTTAAQRMIGCVDWVYSNHEDNVAFFHEQFSFKDMSYLPFSADERLFQEFPSNKKQPKTLCFKGFIKDFGFSDGPYKRRSEIAQALEVELGDQFVFHQDNVPDGEYAKILSSFDYHINLPSFSQSMTARAAEVLVCGALLFQYKPSGEKTNEFFQHGRDMIFYDPDDIGDLIDKVKYYFDNPSEAKRIAESGHKRFMSQHSMPQQVKSIYNSWARSPKLKSNVSPVVDKIPDLKIQTGFLKPSKEVLGNLDWNIIKQIDFNKVLYADQYYLAEAKESHYKRIPAIWLNNYSNTAYDFPKKSGADYLCISSMARPDYSSLFRSALSVIPEEDRLIIENYERNKDDFDVKASQFMTELRPLMNCIKAEKQSDVLPLFVRLCKYLYILKHLVEYDFKYLVCFADMQPLENLLAQYAKLSGKKTVTLQHGLYVDYKKYRTVNIINYLHHVCDHFLAWGEETQKLINRYHPNSNVVVCGKPVATLSEKTSEQNFDTSKPYLSVVVDQRIFDEQNIEILRIASSYGAKNGLDVNVKFHPQSDRKKYRALGIDFVENLELEKSAFVLGHSSSLMYELMGRGVQVYRFQSDLPNLPLDKSIVFSSEKELTAMLGREFDYAAQYSKFIAFNNDRSLGEYRRFFKSLEM